MCILRIIMSSTPAEAAWCNGISKKNHATIDTILVSLLRTFPSHDRNLLLAWACSLKNSLDNVNGFSPNPLVFRKNPRLPCILNDNPRSLQGTSDSDSLTEHLNTLHAARVEYAKAEASQRLKQALLAKIDTSGDIRTGLFLEKRSLEWSRLCASDMVHSTAGYRPTV